MYSVHWPGANRNLNAVMHTAYRFLLIFFFCSFVSTLWSQQPGSDTSKVIEIRNADLLLGSREEGQSIQTLRGRVVLFHEGAYMYADSALIYESTNSMDAFGHIHIRQGDTLSLYGDSLHYDGNTRKAEIWSRVRMLDPQVSLETTRMEYDRNTGKVWYPQAAEIRNGQDDISSKTGVYDTRTRSFTFKDDVVITNPEYQLYSDTLHYDTRSDIAYFRGPSTIYSEGSIIECRNGWYDKKQDRAQFNKDAKVTSDTRVLTGDSLYYERRSGYGKGVGNVLLVDTVEKVTVSGQFSETWEDLRRYYVTDSVLMTQVFDQDTLFVTGDTLFGKRDSMDLHSIRAYAHVKFYKSDLQGASDSLFFSENDSLMRLRGRPVMWSDSSQMTAKRINITMAEGEILGLDLDSLALMISRDDSIRFNQVAGERMHGYFRENTMYRLDVFEQGRSIYHPREEDSSLTGLNEVFCRNMHIYIEENQVVKIVFLEEPYGTMFPWEDVDPKAYRLEGFSWQAADRPKSPMDIYRERP